MDKKKFLQSIGDSLEAAGFSVNDLVKYCAEEKKKPSAGSSLKEFPFEVMYEGMVRSWVPLKGKKPLGVIFENHLITLYDSPETMVWEYAMVYCEEIKIEACAGIKFWDKLASLWGQQKKVFIGGSCEAGKIEFWKKLVALSEPQKLAFDKLMVWLGGEPIALSEKRFWSSSYYGTGSNMARRHWLINLDNSYEDAYVRPVLALS